MPVKTKISQRYDYFQEKPKRGFSEDYKKKERKLLSKFPLSYRGAVKLQIIEPSWKISASVLNL